MFGKRRDGAGAGQSVHVAASCSFTSCLLIAGPDPVKAAIPASLDCAQVCWARLREILRGRTWRLQLENTKDLRQTRSPKNIEEPLPAVFGLCAK